MPIETIVAPVGKSNSAFELQTDIIFVGNGGAKINKFLDYMNSMVNLWNTLKAASEPYRSTGRMSVL